MEKIEIDGDIISNFDLICLLGPPGDAVYSLSPELSLKSHVNSKLNSENRTSSVDK